MKDFRVSSQKKNVQLPSQTKVIKNYPVITRSKLRPISLGDQICSRKIDEGRYIE